MRGTAVAPLLLAAGLLAQGAPARATQDFGSLLSDLGIAAPEKKEGRVRVVARIERDAADGSPVLAIDFLPQGEARLVADPGITVLAVAAEGVRWPAGGEARAVLPGTAYFDSPPRVRLPVEAEPGTVVEADVDYAWCLVGWQCLFGNERVRAVVPAAATTPSG